MALGTSALAGQASAQVRIVTGDGLCPPGEAPMTLAQANAQRDSLCRSLGRWHIARLADGASMDGPGYQCQMRANDTRSLGHTICAPAANVGPVVPPPAMLVTPGVYDGWHPHWQDTVTLSPDGSYQRGNGDPGRWSVEGRTLVLAWRNWGPERLDLQPDGSYRAATNGFTLRLRANTSNPQVVVVAPPPPGLDPSVAIGEYDAQHPQWRDPIELLASSSLRRRGRAAGRWRIEGAELVLSWRRGPETRLALQADGSWRSFDGLVLTRKLATPTPPPPPPPTTGPRVRVRITH